MSGAGKKGRRKLTILTEQLVTCQNIAGTALPKVTSIYTFTYDKAYLSENASAVHLLLPLSKREAYSSKALFSFCSLILRWLLDVLTVTGKSTAGQIQFVVGCLQDCIGNVTIMEEKL